MTPSTTIHHRSDLAGARLRRRGMSLLEVLVALGILVAGLASVAALMPAAGARLADATAIDRAGTLAANAHADLRNRGLLTASLFPANTDITGSSTRICVIGDAAFPDTPFASGTFTSGTFHKFSPPSTLTMTLQDDLQLSGTTLSVNATSVSYAATVLPTATGTISAGSPVRVGVAVFKRPNVEHMTLQLTKRGAGIFEVTTSTASTAAERIIQNDSFRKRFLPACSWAFAANGTTPTRSRWLQVASSWTMQSFDSNNRLVLGTSFVSFADADAEVVASIAVSGTLTVQAFTNVLRVDERPAILK